MKKKIRIISLVSLLLLSIFSTQSVLASESVDDENDNGGYIADDTERLEESFSYDGYSLTTKYDPRESNHLTDIRNQSDVGICWMYAAVSTEEQFIATRYGRKFDVSELHGAVALSDCIKKENKNQTESGYYNTGPERGSTQSVAAQYLTNWNTPIFYKDVYKWHANVSEAEYPLSIFQIRYNRDHNLVEIKDNGDAFTDSKSLFNLTDFRYISKDIDNVKYAIQNYGAVGAGIFYKSNMVKNVNGNEQTLNNLSDAYLNHAISIVGWDDDFSKDNFRNGYKPKSNGAWLVKNSWGYQDIRSGYMWISYEDATLNAKNNPFAVTTGVQPADESEYMLSYDYLPITNIVKPEYILKDRVFLANVYDVSSFTDTYECINKGKITCDGRRGEMSPAVAKLLKLLDLPVVVCCIKGCYLFRPKWAYKKRKSGGVEVHINPLFSTEEMKTLSVEEIFDSKHGVRAAPQYHRLPDALLGGDARQRGGLPGGREFPYIHRAGGVPLHGGNQLPQFALALRHQDGGQAYGKTVAPRHQRPADEAGYHDQPQQVRVGSFGQRQILFYEPPREAILRAGYARGAGGHGKLLSGLVRDDPVQDKRGGRRVLHLHGGETDFVQPVLHR